MTLSKESIVEIAEAVSKAVVDALDKRNLSTQSNVEKRTKSAYQKTEALLYNYCGFKRIVDDRMREIEELRVHGVPRRDGSIVQYSSHSGTVAGTVLPEESVEAAIRNVEATVQTTVAAIAMIDRGMATLKTDPWYRILEMQYFEGRTQEDIAFEFGCSQQNISHHRSRLVKALSMELFPSQVVEEMMR